jgi:hypothetical protein
MESRLVTWEVTRSRVRVRLGKRTGVEVIDAMVGEAAGDPGWKMMLVLLMPPFSPAPPAQADAAAVVVVTTSAAALPPEDDSRVPPPLALLMTMPSVVLR